MSKQIPLKVNGFAETKNFPHLLRKISRKPKGIAKIWNFLHLQSLVETGPIESQWICLAALFFCFLRGFWDRIRALQLSRTLHRPAPDPLLRPIDGRYGQEGWYPRRDPTTRLAALDAERIPDRKNTSRCVMTTLHLGRDDRGKENAVSPP